MTLLASSLGFSCPSCQFKPGVSRSWPGAYGHLSSYSQFQVSPSCSMKMNIAQFGEPEKLKEELVVVLEKVPEAVPKAVKDFPWKEAENLVLERLIFLGKKVLKWSFVAWFVISSISDVMISISTNQELMIPFGLLIGCLMCDFLKETVQEMPPNSEGKALNWQFVGISSFFVLVKFLSGSLFGLKARVFLFHVGNGGILQVLWLFQRSLLRENGEGEENLSLGQDASTIKNA